MSVKLIQSKKFKQVLYTAPANIIRAVLKIEIKNKNHIVLKYVQADIIIRGVISSIGSNDQTTLEIWI